MTSFRVSVAALACLIAIGLVFHAQLGNGFATVSIDPWDGRIEVALLEHWWNAVRHLEPWRAPLWFSPSTGSLGYNDGYLMFGLVHAVFRWCGIDPFLSAELVTLVVRAVGFPGFLLLAQQSLKLSFWPALAGATVFTMANNMAIQMEHAQLVTVSLAPWLCWLMWGCWSALGQARPGRAFAWGLAAAALISLWLMTAFYTLWFMVLFLCILAAFSARWLARNARRFVTWPVLASVAAAATGTIPFLWVYWPTRHETGGRQFSEVLGFAPRLGDFIDLGAGNLLWGRLAEGLRISVGWTMVGVGEHVVGWPPLLLAAALAGFMVGLIKRDVFWVALGAATLFAALLPVAWGSGQWTAWSLVYAIVPGASAIRSTTRFALVLTLPVTLLASYALGSVRRSRVALLGLVVVLVFEEVNIAPVAEWPRERYLAELDVPPAPGVCSHFIVKKPRDPDANLPSILMNVEAMIVAERLHVPTLNGYASFFPKYGDTSYSQQAEYEWRMATQAIHAGLTEGLCELDLQAGVWKPFLMPETAGPALGRAYRLADNAVDGFIVGSGWSGPEGGGRWIEGDTGMLIFRNPAPDKPMRLTLRVKGYPPSGPRAAMISYEGISAATWYPGSQPRDMVAELPPRPDGLVRVTIQINAPRSEAELGLGSDRRRLGLFVESAELSEPAR